MVKALKNPHYKSILEEVNWKGRHPEAKSLEEALEMETKKFGCELFNYGETFCHARVVGNNCAGYQYLTVESVDSSNVNPMVIHLREIGKNVQILGKPIMLEDIMMILPKTFAYWNAYNSIVDIQFSGGHHVIGFNLQWLPSKPLHEQSEDTWAKLCKFINTRQHILTVDELPNQTHGIN